MQAEFTIKTKADLQGAKQVQQEMAKEVAELQKAGTATAALTQKKAELKRVNAEVAAAEKRLAKETADALREQAREAQKATAEAKKAEAAINKAARDAENSPQGSTTDALRRVPLVGGLIDGVESIGSKAAAGILAVASAALTGARALAEYAGAEERVASLDAALAQRGQLTEEYRVRLQALAGSLQDLTSIADDQWIEVLTRLTQFGSDSTTIERNATAVKNLAGILNGDLNSAALLVGKAIQRNFIAFSKLGITFDENATQAEKLDKLFTELATRGGGQLEARAKTINGQFRDLKNQTADLSEAFGRAIGRTGILQSVMESASRVASTWARIIGGPVEKLKDLQNAQKDTKIAIEETNVPITEQAKQLTGIADASQLAAKGLSEYLSLLNSTASQEEAIIEKEKRVQLALIDRDLKERKISAPEAEVRRAAVEADAIVRKRDVRESAVNRGLQAEEEVLSMSRQAAGALQSRIRDNQARLAGFTTPGTEKDKQEMARVDKELAALERNGLGDTQVAGALRSRRAGLEKLFTLSPEKVAEVEGLRGLIRADERSLDQLSPVIAEQESSLRRSRGRAGRDQRFGRRSDQLDLDSLTIEAGTNIFTQNEAAQGRRGGSQIDTRPIAEATRENTDQMVGLMEQIVAAISRRDTRLADLERQIKSLDARGTRGGRN